MKYPYSRQLRRRTHRSLSPRTTCRDGSSTAGQCAQSALSRFGAPRAPVCFARRRGWRGSATEPRAATRRRGSHMLPLAWSGPSTSSRHCGRRTPPYGNSGSPSIQFYTAVAMQSLPHSIAHSSVYLSLERACGPLLLWRRTHARGFQQRKFPGHLRLSSFHALLLK